MAESAIEWTDSTWNPVSGCDRVSPGCANCYALTLAKRLKAMGHPGYQRDGGRASGPGFGVTLHPHKLDEPLRWRKPRMVFVNSMSDLFHEEVPFEFIDKVFGVMWRSPQHTFQVLTKRPERAREYLDRVVTVAIPSRGNRLTRASTPDGFIDWQARLPDVWPLPNVWLGVSIENARYTWRADVLRQIPAAVRFISAEPLLGSLFEHDHGVCESCGHSTYSHLGTGCDTEVSDWGDTMCRCDRRFRNKLDLSAIDWIIAGGESGPRARPMDLRWVDDLLANCREHDVAPFVKQLGAVWAREVRHRWQLPTDSHGGDWQHWPERLRIREFPRSAA